MNCVTDEYRLDDVARRVVFLDLLAHPQDLLLYRRRLVQHCSDRPTLADQLVLESLLVFLDPLLAVLVGHVVDDAVQVDLFLRSVAVVLSAELLDLVFVHAHDELRLRSAFRVLFDDDAVAIWYCIS